MLASGVWQESPFSTTIANGSRMGPTRTGSDQSHRVRRAAGLAPPKASCRKVPSQGAPRVDDPTTAKHPEMSPAVAKCLRRLRHGSPVRAAAEQILRAEPVDNAGLGALTSAVLQRSIVKWRERVVAAWCLAECDMSEEAREDALEALRVLVIGKGFFCNLEWIELSVARGVLVAAAIIAPLKLASVSFWPEELGGAMGALLVWTATVVIGSLLAAPLAALPMLVYSRIRESANLYYAMAEAARTLGRLSDPLSVGLLARAASHRNVPFAQAAREALPSALAAVRQEHYAQLPLDATPAMCELLYSPDRQDAIPVLYALGRAGDGRAAGPVRWLIDSARTQLVLGHDAAAREVEQAVVSAGESVLPILEERLRLETDSARLLRPASPESDESLVLLRPAGAANAVPEEQLLRPSAGPNG